MTDKIDQIATTMTHTGAGVALGSFFSLKWWNENSAAIVAICAAVGAALSVIGFIIGQIHRHRSRRYAIHDHSQDGMALIPFILLLCIVAMVLVTRPVWAAEGEALSEHNEQHAAEMAAQNKLFDAGCTRTNIKRAKRWAVQASQEAQSYTITGNSLTVECVKWESPTGAIWKISWSAPIARADGAPLRSDEIAGYRITVNGTELEPSVASLEIVTDRVSLGDIVGLQTVDKAGRESVVVSVVAEL